MHNTMLILAGAGVALLLLFLLLMRGGKKGTDAPAARPLAASRARATAPSPVPRTAAGEGHVDRFRGGMLFPQPDACEAVCELRGKTFPEGKIPPVPVPGCDRARCDCQVHTVVGRRRGARRVQSDRREDIRLDEDRRSGGERREG
jgi:hypothetical protein